jgi:hypothetical protein
MQVEFKDNHMLLVPQSAQEKEGVTKLFPVENHTLSKRVKVKPFVDKFGSSTGEFYVEVKGFNKTVKESK